MLVIITGPRGAGKTTALQSHIQRLRHEERKPKGLLTPPLLDENGLKTGFDAMSAETGEFWELARCDKKLEGPSYGPFSFSSEGFQRALKLLDADLQKGLSSPFFLDEIGPLELHGEAGFFPLLPKLAEASEKRDIYLVIRPELIDEFLSRYAENCPREIININSKNRDNPDLFNTRE